MGREADDIPRISRSRPAAPTLPRPMTADAIAGILNVAGSRPRNIMAPAYTTPSPSLFPLTAERFGREPSVRPAERDCDPALAETPSFVEVHQPTPALPEDADRIPTPLALEHDTRLTEEDAKHATIWMFRDGVDPHTKPSGTIRRIA